ncbi:MAG: 3D domain-containing protein [Candidatus Niyogibacteria bacterium]|nr:3D domain-containing protein [Candidatus Niyogibacteria bacterium]
MITILKSNNFWLNRVVISLIILVLTLNASIKEASAAWDYSDIAIFITNKMKNQQKLLIAASGDFSGDSDKKIEETNKSLPPKTIKVVLTGYSSTIDQTDDTPFITASNTRVRDGVVAANFLAFGTKVQIPALFGNKIFIVEDRMAKKHNNKIDIWFSERYLAKNFGVKETEVMILE